MSNDISEIRPGDHVKVTITGEVDAVSKTDVRLAAWGRWFHPSTFGGAKTIVEKVSGPDAGGAE